MKDKHQMRIALIGLGDIAQKAYLPIVANHPKINPILCTRNVNVLRKLSLKYRIHETYTSIEELILNKPDAAMIHSATASHFNIVRTLLKAQIPVFVDKPLSYSLAECEQLLDLATQHQTILYLGFNRRFAPFIRLLKKQKDPTQIFWKKNRVNLPDNPRIFIFDDFVHVVDSLRFLSSGPIENIRVFSNMENNKLKSVQVQWEQSGTFLHGVMNRDSGITEERVEYYTPGNKWQINELDAGFHYENEIQNVLKFDNWKSTLYKRGFVDLIEDWLHVLQVNKIETSRIQDIWETHNLCEIIVKSILNNKR